MMAKGIIVLDDIPVICAECDFATITPNKGYLRCEAKNRIIYNAKPNWCPIKLMLDKKDTKNAENMTSLGWIEGWNACIDEIESER